MLHLVKDISKEVIIIRILVIGSPGSGKSTLSKEIAKIFSIPILHLDKMYHIDNKRQISKEELRNKIANFIEENTNWIIDGNYGSSMKYRSQYADWIIFMDIKTRVCLRNIRRRQKNAKHIKRSDMASGFIEDKLDMDFIEYVKSFRKNHYQNIHEVISEFNGKVTVIKNYREKDQFLEEIRND